MTKYPFGKKSNNRTEFDFEFDLDSFQPRSDFHPYRHITENNKIKKNITDKK